MVTENRLAVIEKRWAKTTPGKWRWYHWGDTTEVQCEEECPVADWQGFDDSNRSIAQHKRNASFIAHAHDDVPWLIARVRELTEKLALAESVVDAVIAVKTHSEAVEARLDRDNEWEFTDEEMAENNRLVDILDAALREDDAE